MKRMFARRVPTAHLPATHLAANHFRLLPVLVVLAASAVSQPARADAECAASGRQPALQLRLDNDLFGAGDQDQGYSSGFMATAVSPALSDYVSDPCVPSALRGLNRHLGWLQPAGADERNVTYGVAQMIYTPTEAGPSAPIPDDRPYAAALMLNLGYNARSGDALHSTQLGVGVLGPAAGGRQIQRAVHHLTGTKKFNGWSNQLGNEPLLQLTDLRSRRWAPPASASGWGWDVVGHAGATLGNFATYANAGGELRFGYRIPQDFGSSSLRPAGATLAPGAGPVGWRGHAFIAMDNRWVLRDITLDGSSFRSSPSVDKRRFVADLGYGLAFTHGDWQIVLARYHRTREFDGQRERPQYGSVTLSTRF